MALEAAGLAVGVFALAGAFKDCIDLFSLIRAARRTGRDYHILETKLDIEKTLLFQWADQVRLLNDDYDRRLDNPVVQKAVLSILDMIHSLLSESDALEAKYGLAKRMEDAGEARGDMGILSARRHKSFTDAFGALSLRSVKPNKKSISVLARWVIKDKEQFEQFVKDLSHFVDKLRNIVPDLPMNKTIIETMKVDMVDAELDVSGLRLVTEAETQERPEVAQAASERIKEITQHRILSKLWFASLESRQQAVSPQLKNTFEWALATSTEDSSGCGLAHWLRQGSGLFWVRGKAGSGKSTLMKFICEDERTNSYLSCWADNIPLRVLRFFFWRLGTEDQRSQLGLLRALVYQILNFDRSLIAAILPKMWETASTDDRSDLALPGLDDIRTALRLFAENHGNNARTCIFIDGLDEFSGDALAGISIIKDLAACSAIKILVSSRPEPEIVMAFESSPHIRLETLTKGDIDTYVKATVGCHPYIRSLVELEPAQTDALLSDLVDRAAGVFLWVVLACRSLLGGFAAYDRVDELRARVDELPPELTDLFTHMLLKVDRRYRSQTATLLKICHTYYSTAKETAESVLPLWTLGFALFEREQLDTARNFPGEELSISQILSLCRHFEGRLRSRSGGLLEVVFFDDDFGFEHVCSTYGASGYPVVGGCWVLHTQVTFFHRTVFEFLEGPEVWGMECLSMPPFDVYAGLAAVALYTIQLSTARTLASRFNSLGSRHLLEVLCYISYLSLDRVQNWYPVFDMLETYIRNIPSPAMRSWIALSPTKYAISARFFAEVGLTAALTAIASESYPITDPPLLVHAMSHTFLSSMNTLSLRNRFASIRRTVRSLLSLGHDPNIVYNVGGTLTTPWAWWLDRLSALEDDPCALSNSTWRRGPKITREFVQQRAWNLDRLSTVLEWAWRRDRRSPFWGSNNSADDLASIIAHCQDRLGSQNNGLQQSLSQNRKLEKRGRESTTEQDEPNQRKRIA